MLGQPASRLRDAEISPDQSSCSSDTGDVLIRSTQVRVHEARPGPGSVQITVQKLADPPVQVLADPPVQPPLAEQQRRPKLRQKPEKAAPLRAAARSQPDRRTMKKPEPTKENREPTGTQPPAAECSPHRKLSAGTHSDRQPGHELLTSRFAAGGRGVVLAALKERSHSAPRRREVKVQLLDPEPLRTSSQHGPGLRTNSQDAVGVAGVQMDATNTAAAAAAAALVAAAPLMKAQSDMEVRVCQLTEGIQKLLQTDRGRSLSHQTLQHLETLQSHQLQLQSQLLESALRIVTAHATVTPVTSDPAASSDRLQVTHLDAADFLGNLQQTSSVTRAGATVETGPVAMATPRHDRWPEQSRDDPYCQGAPSVSTATQPAAGSHLLSSANHSQAVATRANEMLREMGRLKTEMKMLLKPEDSLKTTRPGPDQHQQNLLQPQQQNLSPPIHIQSQQTQPQQTQPQQTQFQQNQSQQTQFQFQQNQSQQTQSQFQQNQSQQTQPQQNLLQSQQQNLLEPNHFQSKSQQTEPQQVQTQQSQSVLVQRRPLVRSMLEEAGQVLRQVQRQKKVLEENLEALLRAKTGEVLDCQLETLAANRDWTEEVRIKKTVDAWISTMTKDIQADISSDDAVNKPSASRDATVTSQQRAAGSSAPAGRGRPVSALRGPGSKRAAGRGSRGQTSGHRPEAEPGRRTGGAREQVEVDGESYLTRLYGRAPYEGLRRTLKKSPYLRFSSPASPASRKPRPRLVESVRGVKVKSCKTQTCLAPPLSLSPQRPQRHYIISSSHLTSGDPADLIVTPPDSDFVPMAIPLGRPRMDSSSRCLTERQQEVTSPLTAPPISSVVAVDDEASELQSQEAQQLGAGEAPPPAADIIERKHEEEEDEENVFPGTDFLSVADIIQQQEGEEEEEEQQEGCVVGEEVLEVDGGPSPPPVLYQGPVFPPQALPALPAQDQASIIGLNLQRDALETRLVEWVEQQLMSRMISEMYRPPPSDPAQNDSTNQSESEERSVTSDIVEAAGGAGLQLFVDSNVSVDSALIRQLVDEVLTEHVALMLGHKDTQEPGLEVPKPGPGAHEEEELVPPVPTPVPTPPPSPKPPSRETPPLTTPPPSDPTSLLDQDSPQPITAAEAVATPTPSPEPAHSAGSPPVVHQAPPPLTWGDAELPLDEERPEEHMDPDTQPLVMSVAEEEPPLSSPLPPPPPSIPAAPSPSPPPLPRPASSSSSSSSSEDSSSSSSSSSVVTAGTDAALKHISEGELLISVNQLAAMTEEEAVCSFSSSLQELQEMDFDPPSEGQVRGHDLLLTLLTKMEQGVTHTHRGERPQPEGSWGRDQEEEEEEVSVGEVRDDRTTNPKSYRKSTAGRRGQTSSPGQISQCADVSEVSFEANNKGSVTVGDLMAEPIGTLTSDLHSDLSLSPNDTQTAGTRRMDVHLPFIRPEEEEEQEEQQESAADTDSSTNNVF